jgi:hypothetical protein
MPWKSPSFRGRQRRPRMKRLLATLGGVLFALACSARIGPGEGGSATFVLPGHYVEADGGAPSSTSERKAADEASNSPPVDSLTADEPAGSAPAATSGDLPDPKPLRTDQQWAYTLRYARGDVRVEGVEHRVLDTPRVTERRIGRFAIELWIGRELVDRVRFDFPLIGSDAPPSGPRRPLAEPPTMLAGADVGITVLVPESPRATYAVLVDRATGKRRALPWPPDRPIDRPVADPN